MLTFLKIAWRNIIRNKRRSLITVSAVGFGLGALIFIWSFVEGAHRQMIENYTSLATSHIQIHAQGFHQHPKLETALENSEQILDQLRNSRGVAAATRRIKTIGLVSSTESSAGILVMGVDPKHEPKVSTLYRRLKSGVFLDEESSDAIIIGDDLAQNLNVGLGDKVVIMSQAFDGSIAAGAYHVSGLLDTGAEEIDKGLALIPYRSAEEIFVMEGRASEIAVKLTSADQAEPVAGEFKTLLKEQGFEILPWQEISPSFLQWIEFDNGFIWIIVFVIMIVVAIGILNTILMGVLERTHEFGILLALGTKPRQILATVTWESLFLGMIGSGLGLGLGAGLNYYFSEKGIDLSVVTTALNSLYIDSVIYPLANWDRIIISTALVLGTSLFASIYPAWHAAHLKPVEAIRSI